MRCHAITIAICLLCVGTAMGQYERTYPRVLLPFENSVCRVSCDDGGSTSHGSGVLLEAPESHRRPGLAYILTAYHVIRDRAGTWRDITVSFDGSTKHIARVAAALPACDSVLLLVEGPIADIPRIPLADTDIQPGELAYGFGFGSDGTLRSAGGRNVGYRNNTGGASAWFNFAGFFRDGDSGGPVFVVRNGQPYLVGNGWGCVLDSSAGHYVIVATRLAVVRHMFGLDRLSQPVQVARQSPIYTQPVTYSSGST